MFVIQGVCGRLYCATGGTCQTAAGMGQNCQVTDGRCANGWCKAGQCAAFTAVGQGCSSGGECGPNAFCSTTSATCTANGGAGVLCSNGDECMDGLSCQDGHCVADACRRSGSVLPSCLDTGFLPLLLYGVVLVGSRRRQGPRVG